MIDTHTLELFVLKCAVIQTELQSVVSEYTDPTLRVEEDFIGDKLEPYIKQFELENRQNAARMARYYQIFYMLENDIRKLISETMEAAHGSRWWDTHVPQNVKDEARKK